MYKSRAIVTVIVLALVTAFFIWAILPALKGGSEGYAIKEQPAPAVVQPAAEPAVTAAEVVAEPTDEAAVEPVAEPAIETTVTTAVEEMAQDATTAVETAVEAVETTVAEATQVVEEQVAAVTTAAAGASGDLYSVVDGNKLDAFSYDGFKLFRNWCARCHGTYGQGMVGPNLADSLNVISKEQFVETVTNGKTGQIGSMPAWSSNATVMAGLDKLYAYLKARADGAIGEVKPAKQ